jgi:hypothetical protein
MQMTNYILSHTFYIKYQYLWSLHFLVIEFPVTSSSYKFVYMYVVPLLTIMAFGQGQGYANS